jgi:hypothetical protein
MAQNHCGDEVSLATRVLECVRVEQRYVGHLADLDAAEVISSQTGGSAPGRQAEGIGDRHGLRSIPHPRREDRLFDFHPEVIAVVRCAAVDSEAHSNTGLKKWPYRGQAGGQEHVRRWTVSDAGMRACHKIDRPSVEVDAVRQPDIIREPSEIVQEPERGNTKVLAAVFLFVPRFGDVGMQPDSKTAGQVRRLSHQVR